MNHPINEPLLPLLAPGDRVRVMEGVNQDEVGEVVGYAENGRVEVRSERKGTIVAFRRKWLERISSSKPETLAPPTCGIKKWWSVNQYPSHNCLYYRFAWGEGSKTLGQRHIPGGCVQEPQAIANAKQVEQWISEGSDPVAIVAKIGCSLQKGRRGRKLF